MPKDMTGELWLKFLFGIVLALVSIWVLGAGDLAHNTKAPLLALTSAVGAAIGIIDRNEEPLAMAIRLLLLSVSAVFGVSAAWEQLLSVEPSLLWKTVGVVLVSTALLILLNIAVRELERLSKMMAEAKINSE